MVICDSTLVISIIVPVYNRNVTDMVISCDDALKSGVYGSKFVRLFTLLIIL